MVLAATSKGTQKPNIQLELGGSIAPGLSPKCAAYDNDEFWVSLIQTLAEVKAIGDARHEDANTGDRYEDIRRSFGA